jgi:hypothetical protein
VRSYNAPGGSEIRPGPHEARCVPPAARVDRVVGENLDSDLGSTRALPLSAPQKVPS